MIFCESVETENAPDPWQILIVDDDDLVHQITKLSLEDVEFDGREMAFTSVYSAQEANEILEKGKEFALVLLDVVMESELAGFSVVEHLRNTLKNIDTRIVMRTGQPGRISEDDAIKNYAINDYRMKTDLPMHKLRHLMYTHLRTYSQMKAIRALYQS